MNALTPFTRFSLTTSILALSLFSTVINAEEQAAHEHGAARLTIATNDVGIEISLQSPAANIFGFEYVASSDSDHHTLQKALGTLKNGGALFLDSAVRKLVRGGGVEGATPPPCSVLVPPRRQ